MPVAEAVTLGATDGAAGVADTGVPADPAAADPADVGDPAGVLAELTAGALLDD